MIKSVFIADNIHGAIPLTQFEKAVISTQIFNRLHNVLQNSTVYFTYPTNRTSRFAHSLGTMHLAGEIYYRSILNADPDTQKRFLSDLLKEILLVTQSSSFKSAIANCLRDFNGIEALSAKLITDDIDIVYQEHLPNLPGGPKHHRAFLVGFQAIRLVGLLHDIGHPPFSHISEFALADLWALFLDRRESGQKLTSREDRFLDILKAVREEERETSIHEGIGSMLAETLLLDAFVDQVERNPDNNGRTFFLALSQHLSLRILSNKSRFSKALHCIVASDFDADRLDFVARDSLASGISAEPFRYDRLRNHLRLVMVPGEDDVEVPLFLPSVRALADIERFYRLYQDLYRYVVYHHRVVRTDGLMKLAILQLAKEYLSDPDEDTVLESALDVPDDVSGLWITLDSSRKASQQDFINQYIQWDDPWLTTILRGEYVKAVKDRGWREDIKQPLPLEMRLEEILSNRRRYQSLYKGVEAFIEVDEAFVEALPLDFDVRNLLSEDELEEEDVTEYCSLIRDLLHEIGAEGVSLETLRQECGFFLSLIRILWLRAQKSVFNQGMSFVDRSVEKLLEGNTRLEISDVFVVPKVLKHGVDRTFLLHSEGRLVELPSVSRLANDLEINANHFPPFFTYVTCNRVLTEDELSQLRSLWGKQLAASFLEEKPLNTDRELA